jgi:hypothetical protein
MRLRGYRDADAPMLTGPYPPGELLGLPPADRPALAEPASVPPPEDREAELCIAPDVGFARFSELDPVARCARLETGVRPEAAGTARDLLDAALAHGFEVLNLRRLHGFVTPAAGARADLLAEAGFEQEAAVPNGAWYDGRPVDRQIWAAVRHG